MSNTAASTVVSIVPVSCHCQEVPFAGAHHDPAGVGVVGGVGGCGCGCRCGVDLEGVGVGVVVGFGVAVGEVVGWGDRVLVEVGAGVGDAVFAWGVGVGSGWGAGGSATVGVTGATALTGATSCTGAGAGCWTCGGAGATDVDLLDQRLLPAFFTARTWNTYVVPLASPSMVVRVDRGCVFFTGVDHVAPPSVEYLIWKPRILAALPRRGARHFRATAESSPEATITLGPAGALIALAGEAEVTPPAIRMRTAETTNQSRVEVLTAQDVDTMILVPQVTGHEVLRITQTRD